MFNEPVRGAEGRFGEEGDLGLGDGHGWESCVGGGQSVGSGLV
jgi:hypothetical protein